MQVLKRLPYSVVALLVLASCARTPQLSPDVRALSNAELVTNAPIIVLGLCTRLETVGGELHRPDMALQQVRISLEVENVVRGQVPPGKIVYYAFASADGHAGGAINVFPRPGQRLFAFLRNDTGSLRSMTDVYDSMIAVHSGRHPRLPRGTVSQQISEVLLLPGEQAPLDVYASQVDHDAWVSWHLIGPLETYRLLQKALQNPQVAIRLPVCKEMYETFVNNACVASLPAQLAAEVTRQSHTKYERLAAMLTEQPKVWAEGYVTTEGREWAKERLTALTESINPAIHENACRLLTEYFSSSAPPCAAVPSANGS